MQKKKMIGIIAFIATILTIIVVIVVYHARIRSIRKEAQDYFTWAEKITTFTVKSDCSTKEEFLTELVRLSEWDGEIGDRLDSTVGVPANSIDYLRNSPENGFASWTELMSIELAKELFRLQTKAENSWEYALDVIFDGDDERYGITRKKMEKCHENGFTSEIARTASYAESGDGSSAFECGTYELSRGDELAMDITYGLYPDVIEEGCEEYQKNALKNGSHHLLDNAIWRTELFSKRYGYEPKNLSRVKARKNSKVASERASTRRTGTSTGSRQTGRSTIDPDDHDIEGYYDDNRDIYEDYDDAYEGFLDDKDAWSDY